jgi:hypothetical protein
MTLVGQAYEFSLHRSSSPEEIAKAVRHHGVAHIPSFLPTEDTEALARECRKLLIGSEPWAELREYGSGRSVEILRIRVDAEAYPVLALTFSASFLREIVERYYGQDALFAEQIWVMEDVVGTHTIVQELHYDKLAHLKEFLYLTDVGLDQGPFVCVPRSQDVARGQERARRAVGNIPTDRDARELPGTLADREVAVTGPAGTLIVFDTDIAHRASAPMSESRLVARSLSYAPGSTGHGLYAKRTVG